MSKKQKHSESYKKEAVRLMMGRGDKSVAQVAKELGVSATHLYQWRNRYGEELGFTAPSGSSGRFRSAEQKELEKLRRENRDLKRTNEFLKKAAAFFAKEGT